MIVVQKVTLVNVYLKRFSVRKFLSSSTLCLQSLKWLVNHVNAASCSCPVTMK